MSPRVSVIVPTRDRRALLARALASVDAQGYRDLELIVVDDGSTDGTADWVRARRPGDRLLAAPAPRGAAAARNRGLAEARGEFVAFLDDDDVWRASYLQAQVNQLAADPAAEVGVTGHVEVDRAGRVTRPDTRPALAYASPLVHMLAESPIHTLSVVACRRAAFARIGPLDESLTIVHDLDWYLRLLAAGGRIAFDRTPLVKRAVPGGLVTAHRRWFREERLAHARAFARSALAPAQRRRVRAARALFFARIGLAKGDLTFGIARLAEAAAVAPLAAARIAGVRLGRRSRPRPGGLRPAREAPRS